MDAAALAAELAPLLVGARVDRVYQPAKEQILIRLRRKGTAKLDLLVQPGRFLTLTKRPPNNPDKPSMLAQVLRSHLENSRVSGFRQIGFDRLLRLDMERGDGKRSLVFELFGDGNMLLLDGEGTILLPMRGEEHGVRRLKKGESYKPPPAGPDALRMAPEVFAAALTAGKRDLVRVLAGDLGFGPLWAEELCLRANVEKKRVAAELNPQEQQAVQDAVASLRGDLARNDLAPALVHELKGSTPELVDAVPFVMRRYPAPAFSHEETATFREALDALFVGGPEGEDGDEPDDPRRPRFEEAKGKILFQVRQIEEAIARFDAEAAVAQADGDALYASFQAASTLLADLNRARGNHSWAQVEAKLAAGREAGNPQALQVPELRPHNGTALLQLTGMDGAVRRVEVDLRLSVQDNATAFYDIVKKQRSRRDGAEVARNDTQAKLAALEKAGLDGFGAAPVRVERVSRHFWFESYRWSITPSGFLAVGGRNAGQNDAVVKKYLRDGDRYVHAEIHGAPSIVVRPADGAPVEISADDLRAACHFAVVSSRAWRQAGPASAYWVNASQVSKTPRSGEYVPKGAWMVHGKRNVESDLPMRWWLGAVEFTMDGRPIAKDAPRAEEGPRRVTKLVGATQEALAHWTTAIVEVSPGTVDPNDAAATLAERFGVSIEEAIAVLPAGPVALRDVPA